MWYVWSTLLVVSCTAAAAAERGAAATTRAPPLTLDRQNNELAWHAWLQSSDNQNQNAPPRRITTKSLFITPLVCPKGQRLDQNACVQVVTLNKDEHERILLEQLNALFTSPTSGDIVYDYGDEEPGPLQLSIPIGPEPQAAPLKAHELSSQALDLQPNYVKIDKKDVNKPESDASIEAELELLKLQHSQHLQNAADSSENTNILNHNVMNSLLPMDKPKRDSPVVNATEMEATNVTDQGQKEMVFGHVNVDPVLYNTENKTSTELESEPLPIINSTFVLTNKSTEIASNKTDTILSEPHVLKKDVDKTKLNPENDYADIGEAIKLISRYAEVTTDDNFSKNDKKYAIKDDSILGTRTKLQYRRNKPKPIVLEEPIPPARQGSDSPSTDGMSNNNGYFKSAAYYRYPWQGQHSPTPPPDYPFRRLQDYWPGRKQFGGVYNTAHGNPRRHHHTFPHNYLKPHGFSYLNYPGPHPGLPETYTTYSHRTAIHHGSPTRSHTNNQDLYSLLGLRHWFSSEGTSKR